ncbi:DUF6959 family protein [Rhodanobacter glycinis]|uniref:DUF6959 family protein n=1 Tax=Rhodanobacter glycinis TaxID=582702 RepID=UPI003F7EFAF2
MRTETVEIYSDQTNAAVLRHPGRKFPGMLVQGDSLYALCSHADRACAITPHGTEAYDELNELRNKLWGYLTHYKVVLGEHQIPLPFSEGTCV